MQPKIKLTFLGELGKITNGKLFAFWGLIASGG